MDTHRGGTCSSRGPNSGRAAWRRKNDRTMLDELDDSVLVPRLYVSAFEKNELYSSQLCALYRS